MRERQYRLPLILLPVVVGLLILPTTYLLRGQGLSAPNDPAETLERYLKSVYAGEYESAYRWISVQDREVKTREEYLRENPSFSGVGLRLTRKLADASH